MTSHSVIGTDGHGISGYSHVTITIADLQSAREFYGTFLGLDELPRPEFETPGLWMRVGDLQIHLVLVDRVSPPGNGMPHLAFFVPTETFHRLMSIFRDSGIRFIIEPLARIDFGSDVLAALIEDPFGNLLEFTNVGPLPNTAQAT